MKKILICNHKMFLTRDEALFLKKDLDKINLNKVELILCPSYLNLELFKNYTLGAQNCFYEDKGAFTGEISAYDLYLRGVKYVIVGHNERRLYDNFDVINKKVKAILRNSMTPILCIGETKMDNELRRTSSVLKKQIVTSLKDVTIDDTQDLLIAYEPVWSIGSGKTVEKDVLEDTILYIKKILEELNVKNYKILYGGSVSKKSIDKLLLPSLDGYLLGSASLKIDEIQYILKCIK